MTLSAEYLDHHECWDTEGPTMRGLWERCSPAEREEIRATLREGIHERNARHAVTILRGLPERWRDDVIARVKGQPVAPNLKKDLP